LYNSWKSRAAAIVIAATMVVPALAVASSAGAAAGGNRDAAHACQDGGWQQLVRADQTPFTNEGDCVSYAAHGGTLAFPLPDLVPFVSCGVQSGAIVCIMSVKNVGAAPATGVIGVSLHMSASPSGGCDLSGGAALSDLAPGDATPSLGCAGADWTSVSVHAVVDTTNTILESNETNNAADSTFTRPA